MWSQDKLDALLESSQYKQVLAALGLEQPAPPPHFSAAVPAMMGPERGTRVNIPTLSFAHPASQTQRDVFWGSTIGTRRVHHSFYNPETGRSRLLVPRVTKLWVREKQYCDGHEVENVLIMQPWLSKECEEVSFGQDPEARDGWMASMSSRLHLLSIRVYGWDFDHL